MAPPTSRFTGTTKRETYILSVTPVDYSLTDGTNIPAPLDTPPGSPVTELVRAPTPGGGPLNSHPATPDLTTPAGERADDPHDIDTHDRSRAPSSFRSPTSPASGAAYTSSPPTDHKPGGVRRLFSLNNLRSSFSSSRTSLSLPRGATATADGAFVNGTKRRPSSSSLLFTPDAQQAFPQKRPQVSRNRKSGSWFRRKSGLFMLNSSDDMPDGLEVVKEADARPDTRESKRLKESKPAPKLPELGTLRGGRLSGGDLGWREDMFRR